MQKVKSGYAVLDVTFGRERLNDFLGPNNIGENPNALPVVILGRIDSIHGNDDGCSQEFGVNVSRVDLLDEVGLKSKLEAADLAKQLLEGLKEAGQSVPDNLLGLTQAIEERVGV